MLIQIAITLCSTFRKTSHDKKVLPHAVIQISKTCESCIAIVLQIPNDKSNKSQKVLVVPLHKSSFLSSGKKNKLTRK